MQSKSQRPRELDGVLSTLNVAIETLNLAKEISSITPAKAAFGSVIVLLTMIRESMINEQDCVDLGLSCAKVCKALDRGLKGKRLDELSQSVLEAIEQLTATVTEVQRKIIKQEGRNAVSRLFHAKNDKEKIASWKLDLNEILHIFNTELAINTHTMVVDIHRNVLTGQGTDSLEQPSDAGEIPPPAPRACFGRDELVDKIIGLAENLTPIALIGAGGIGKTSIALAVLHHDRIKQRFRNNRRFIRCDQFTASPANLLRRLSEVIGAGVENPDNLTPLRPSLTSKEMLIVLDNAESILDPRGASGREINAVVRELSQFNNVCLCITSRITTVPSDCKTFEIPTLSMAAARDAFYRIYEYGGQSDSVNDILAQLDFHPLSITLLATVAHQNKWDNSRLVREWEQHLTAVLQTGYNESLAHTIELSLASPMFRELGPDARDLLEVVAFFPQGVDENNLDWLFPNISNRTAIFDTFCILSLAYRNNGFVTMLAPLRDHLHPKDPTSSPLLCATKDRYFTRLSAGYHYPNSQESEAQWIVTEDTNAEHLVYIFASFGAGADQVWEAYAAFIKHLRLHKPRHTILKQTIESLPDDHPSKPECLFELAELLRSVGNHVGQKKLLNHALALVRKQGDDPWVAKILTGLANANRMLGLHGEGIKQAREALEIFEQLNDTVGRARCLAYLSMLLQVDNQLDAAIEAASLAIILLPERGQEYLLSQSQRLLGNVYHFKGEREKAIHHFEAALEIASPLNFQDPLFWINHSLACLFLDGGEFDHAHAYIQQAKSHAVNNPLSLGYAMECRARIWFQQRRLEEAISEALRALDVYEKLGATEKSKVCGTLVQQIEKVITRAKNESK